MPTQEIYDEAINLVQNEVRNWERGEAFITDTVSFNMTNLVKKARKNYFGVFEKEYDPITGRKKVFVPLTEKLVEDTVKNIDIDTSAIRVKGKNKDSFGVASVFRFVLKHYLDKIGFGKLLNSIIRMVAIDGTCFVKSWRDGSELRSRVIDRLNIIVDPSANSLDETPITERNFLALPEFRQEAKAGNWINWEDVEGHEKVDRTGFEDMDGGHNVSEVPMVDVYERYGWIPKHFVTGKDEDNKEYVYGLIVLSDIKGSAKLHLIKEVEKHPFVMFRFKDIWNRLDGRGIGEMILNLQAYVNEIVNTRINKHRVSHLGLFKMRGSVTPQQFSKLFTTHGIKLKSQRDDIEMLKTTDADQSTYQDEGVGKQWAEDVVGSFDEKKITASTPATNALIQERGTASRSNLVQENLGFALEELIEQHYIPIIKKILKKGDVIRITGNPSDLERLQEKFVRNEVYRAAADFIAEGGLVTDDELDEEVIRLTEELNELGEDRFVTVTDKAFDTEFNIDIQISDEELNPALVAQSITQALGIAAQFPGSRLNVDEALREIFDSLGLDGERLIQAQEELGVPQAQLAQAEANAQELGGTGEAANEAAASPVPNSRPVV
jgi:hypothetical protein